jgi:hypothetical protein
MGYRPADGRDGNAGSLVNAGHATVPSFEAAMDELIHDAQLIERSVAAVLICQLPVQNPREFGNDLSCNIMGFIRHKLISVPRISR